MIECNMGIDGCRDLIVKLDGICEGSRCHVIRKSIPEVRGAKA